MRNLYIFLLLISTHLAQATGWIYAEYYPWLWDEDNGWYYVTGTSDYVWMSNTGEWESNPLLTPESFSYGLVNTGQIYSYNNDGEVILESSDADAFYGQDADYLKGNAMSYTDNGDDTITDNNTGLMWMKIPNLEKLSYDEAVEYCENLEYAGYDDWRIPNLKELFSISDFSTGWPYIDTNYFTLTSDEEVSKDEQYWSSNRYVGTTVEGGYNAAFGVNHATGHIKAYAASSGMIEGEEPLDGEIPTDDSEEDLLPPPMDDSGSSPLDKYVRAVRGTEYGINDFTDNADGTVTDNSTGLMWSQSDNGEGVDWEDALSYAEDSELAGYTDWRLPNIKELQSIIDYDYAPAAEDPEFDGPAINPIFSVTPIINEAGNDDYGYAWSSTSALFTSGNPYYYAWYVAFGRAVNDEGADFHGAGAVRFDTKYEGGPAGEDPERVYNFVRLVRDK